MSQAYQNMCAGMYKVGHQYSCSAVVFDTHTHAHTAVLAIHSLPLSLSSDYGSFGYGREGAQASV